MKIAFKVDSSTLFTTYNILKVFVDVRKFSPEWMKGFQHKVGYIYIRQDDNNGWVIDGWDRPQGVRETLTSVSNSDKVVDTLAEPGYVINIDGKDITLSIESYKALKEALQ